MHPSNVKKHYFSSDNREREKTRSYQVNRRTSNFLVHRTNDMLKIRRHWWLIWSSLSTSEKTIDWKSTMKSCWNRDRYAWLFPDYRSIDWQINFMVLDTCINSSCENRSENVSFPFMKMSTFSIYFRLMEQKIHERSPNTDISPYISFFQPIRRGRKDAINKKEKKLRWLADIVWEKRKEPFSFLSLVGLYDLEQSFLDHKSFSISIFLHQIILVFIEMIKQILIRCKKICFDLLVFFSFLPLA